MIAWIIQGIGVAVLLVCGVPIVVAELRGRGVLRFGSSYAEDYLEFLDSADGVWFTDEQGVSFLDKYNAPSVYDQEQDAA